MILQLVAGEPCSYLQLALTEHDGTSYSMSEIVERRSVFMITIRS
jgi:hypothetical protein